MGETNDVFVSEYVLVREVGHISCDLSAVKGFQHCLFINKSVPRVVQHHDTVLHLLEVLGVEIVPGAVHQRNMDSYVIRFVEERVQGKSVLNMIGEVPCIFYGDVWVISYYLHAEVGGHVRYEHSYRTKSDYAYGLALELRADEPVLSLLDLSHDLGPVVLEAHGPFDPAYYVSGAQEQSAEHELLNRIGIGARCIEHHDALLGASVYRDVVDSYACSCEAFEISLKGEGMAVRAP